MNDAVAWMFVIVQIQVMLLVAWLWAERTRINRHNEQIDVLFDLGRKTAKSTLGFVEAMMRGPRSSSRASKGQE